MHTRRGDSVTGSPGGGVGPQPLRLLFVLPFTPRADLMHGGRVISQLLFSLLERHRVAIVHLGDPRLPAIDPGLAERCDLVRKVPAPGGEPAWRRRRHVLTAPLTGIPSAVAPRHSPALIRACLETVECWRPDVVQVEHDTIAFVGPAIVRRATGPAVLTCHDPGPLATRDQIAASSGRQRVAHRLDLRGWRRYWARNLPAFDAIVALTERDTAMISATFPTQRLETIALGVEVPQQPLSHAGRGEPKVAYVGGYSHPPNVDAALRLMTSIMPAVRRELPGVRLEIVGRDPTPEMSDAVGEGDTLTGTVPDVTPFLDEAALVALPIRLAGGMRVKLLEAMAAGKAVIASPLAAAGLAVSDGAELVLAESDAEFSDAIIELLGDPEARVRIGRNAREWAQRHLGWEVQAQEYERLYRSLLSPAPARRTAAAHGGVRGAGPLGPELARELAALSGAPLLEGSGSGSRPEAAADGPGAGPMRQLELLHPDGAVARVVTHGTGQATALAVGRAEAVAGAPDLLVLAPSRGERRDAGWVDEAARLARRLTPDGIVVAPRPTRRLRAALVAAGLEPALDLLHLPDLLRSRYLVPLRGLVADYGIRRAVPLSTPKQWAARALALPGAAALGPTSSMYRRPGARPLLGWLESCGVSPPPATAIVSRGFRYDAAIVAQLFDQPRSAFPARIAKVGGGAAREAEGLRTVAARARFAPVEVPAVVGEGSVAGADVVIETVVVGHAASRYLGGSRARALQLLPTIAGWLSSWNGATRGDRPFEPADAERFVLGPARRLAPALAGGRRYLASLERLCSGCVGVGMPFVAAHNDLTAANILISGEGRGVGVVDWEMAEAEWLPLGDLVYAAVDLAAAVDGYRDRPAAYATCFERDGEFAELLGAELREAGEALLLDARHRELCLHTCWLHHADNEQREALGRGLAERPFLAILQAVAENSPRY